MSYSGMPSYGAPPAGFGAPPPGYGAPPPGYGAPPPGYGAPPSGYARAPSSNPWSAPGYTPQNPAAWALFQSVDVDRSGKICLAELETVRATTTTTSFFGQGLAYIPHVQYRPSIVANGSRFQVEQPEWFSKCTTMIVLGC
jgi:hypothetical protein